MKLTIVYEDDDLWVVDKPAGVVVNRVGEDESVQDWVWERLDDEQKKGDLMSERRGLVHRLDKETSGCLVLAKNEQTLRSLMAQFKKRTVEKEYLALVHGRLEPKEGGVRVPIGVRKGEKGRAVRVEGKKAETWWRVEDVFVDAQERLFSLVRVWPKTGRTHQIRVHLAHLKHPIVADKLYLSEDAYRTDSLKLNRHFLHAAVIKFTQPSLKEEIRVECELPSDLEAFMVSSGFVRVE